MPCGAQIVKENRQ